MEVMNVDLDFAQPKSALSPRWRDHSCARRQSGVDNLQTLSPRHISSRPMMPRGGESGETTERQRQEKLDAVAKLRDKSAFIGIFEHYAPRVKTYLMRLGAGETLAEDLTQEVMLTVWRKATLYDPARAAISTWIFTIARNLRIDALRKETRPEVDPDDPSLIPDPVEAPDWGIDSARQQEKLRIALHGLPEEQAMVVALSFYADKSHGEIAAALGLPLGTVKSRLRLAFRRVRAALSELA